MRVSINQIREMKEKGEPISMLTAYDYSTAKIVDEIGIPMILVGDSLGMVVLGYENTVPVTMEEMLHHTRAVTRAVARALVVGDMPYFSFHLTAKETIRNASRFLKEGGASAVKIEGATKQRLKLIEALVEAEIPVMGHVGLTPQSINHLGQFRVKGGVEQEARKIIAEARALEAAGVFSIVLEAMPLEIARAVTERVSVPTIGIGAGPHCDGQILVFHDFVGYSVGYLPKFVRKYADFHGLIDRAAGDYLADVRRGDFPDDGASYHLNSEAAAALSSWLRAADEEAGKK